MVLAVRLFPSSSGAGAGPLRLSAHRSEEIKLMPREPELVHQGRADLRGVAQRQLLRGAAPLSGRRSQMRCVEGAMEVGVIIFF